MTDKPPTLDDAFALLEAHERTGCLHVAVDYAERVRGIDRETLQRGVAYVLHGLKTRRDKLRAET